MNEKHPIKITQMHLQTEAEQYEYIRGIEAEFLRKLNLAVKEVCEDAPKVLLLSGPTCSCKTTTAHALIEKLAAAGKRTAVISIDDFFRNRAFLDRNRAESEEQPDYDSIDALELPFFASFADAVCQGQPAELPHYDFHAGIRDRLTAFDPAAYDVLLFEGIQAIYPEITRLFAPYPHCEIALSLCPLVAVNGIRFTEEEIRLCRRIVRDEQRRSAPAAFTLFLWESVRRNEEKNILPYQDSADVKIDSYLPYELFVLRDPLLRAIATVPADSRFYEKAKRLSEKISPLPSIAVDLLPRNSVYHEFL